MIGVTPKHDFTLFKLRRKDLVERIKEQYPDQKGSILLCAGFESDRSAFWQESSFYYFTGIHEPGTIVLINLEGSSTLFVPTSTGNRAQWIFSHVPLVPEQAKHLGFDQIIGLGQSAAGYSHHLWSKPELYENVLKNLSQQMSSGAEIFTLAPKDPSQYVEQRAVLTLFSQQLTELKNKIVDISLIVARMRQRKDVHEINMISQAVDITILAQEAASQTIKNNVSECEVQAALEFIMTGSCARPSFPSIVATGKNATILHYTVNQGTLKSGELVVVDIGAAYQNYCADITRTYPVSGSFTKRQRELYNLVLDTQEYIAQLAAPGYWLSNKEHPEKSLHHLAKKYLDERGYGNYFVHGIGHYLGLDVHDVGDYSQPLQEGDVFTIEPGIYIPQEGIGIRIEDDYWMSKDGIVCLSEMLPKKPDDIEAMVQESFDDEFDQDDLDYDESDDTDDLALS